MSMPTETPSRILRRIKEDEARDADMPSLPSLPAFDESAIDEVNSTSFSLEDNAPTPHVTPLATQRRIHQSSPALPHTARFRVAENEPIVQPFRSSAPSLRRNAVETENNHSDACFHSRQRRGEYDEDSQISGIKPAEKPLDIEALSEWNIEQGSDEVDKGPSLAEAPIAVNRKCSPNSSPLPDSTFEVDRNRVPIVKPQGFDRSESTGPFPNSFNLCDFKDVAVRKSHDPTRPPTLAHSLSSSSASTSSLLKSSISHSPKWNSGQKIANSTSQESGADVIHGLQTEDEEHLPPISASGPSVAEDEQNSGKASESQEPTFSSEDAEKTHVAGGRSVHFRFPPAMSSPSAVSTPALTYQSRAGAIRSGGYVEDYQEDFKEADDLATPLPRRKSFLLSVVNSTTRPCLTFPTPHPRVPLQTASNLAAGLIPGPSRPFKVGGGRARLSHPLSQVTTFIPSTPHDTSSSGLEADYSPEGAASASFVSTASSHDLTVHHRANASFDPLTGPQGVGRFNAGKLNTYLHGLNRRLQEENELLVNRIRSQQLELEVLYDQVHHRELSGVVEDEAAEQWVLEKENLEQKVAELGQIVKARDKEIADEQAERMRDKERWKERMTEVENGVGQIVLDLEKRVEEAEMKATAFKDVELQLQDAQIKLSGATVECQLLKQRAEQAEQITANENEAGSALRSANDLTDRLEQNVQTLAHQLQEREDAYTAIQALLEDKEKETSSLKGLIRDLESSLQVSRETIETSQEDARELRREQREIKEELRVAQTTVKKLKADSSLAFDKAKNFEKQLVEAEKKLAGSEEALEIANEQVLISSNELDEARLNAQQLENALEESDKKILSDDKELLELRLKLAIMERGHDKIGSLSQSQDKLKTLNEIDVGALEAELAEATKEIGRLTALLNQNPARRAIEKAKESRINLLEKENEELLDQLRLTRDPSYYAAPFRNASLSGLSPMHRQLINLSMRTPRTPGEPLRNASWLMNMTGDISTTHLMEEIGRLQKELDIANESVDDKLDKLEEAGLGVVGLTKALEDARRRIMSLESQIEEREARWQGSCLCSRCGESEIGGSTSRDPNASLQLRLTMVTAELESLRKQRDEERASSSGEKIVLRDAANRLNIEIRRAKEELRTAQERGHMAEKSKTELQQELIKAKKSIDDLEHHLLSERSRLRTVSVENFNAVKEKERILEKLKETEQKTEQAKDRLFQLKEANIRLEAELRVERKTTNVEEALIVNRETIEHLRQERSQLSDKHFDLQQRLAEASKHASDLATKHANLQMSYDGRRRQLDRQTKEIESLRSAFSSQAETLDQVWSSKKDNPSEGLDLRSLASKLELELKRIQQEANRFGHDLIQLRAERDEMIIHHREELEQHERESKQIRAQLRVLEAQVASRKESKEIVSEINAATESLRLRHNKECKGLFVQIRYLKAKFTREAALRDNLGYQKGYLLVLLSRFEKSEKRILATIARIGPIASPMPCPRFKSLRAVALAVTFISRARQASDAWRERRSACSSIAAALDNVRKNRALKACS